MRRLRNVIRWAFALVALADIVASAPDTMRNWHAWRLAPDPVAAQFWRSAFYMNLSELGIVVGVALFVWFGLRPRKSAVAPSAQI